MYDDRFSATVCIYHHQALTMCCCAVPRLCELYLSGMSGHDSMLFDWQYYRPEFLFITTVVHCCI